MTSAHDEFYRELTARNSGLISLKAQEGLRACRVLIAGCGSTGGAAAVPLARVGVEKFLLAEPDHFELNNLNRQNADVADIGQNKAIVASRRIRSVNPHADCEVSDRGVTAENVAGLVGRAGFIIDGVDVTTVDGWEAKTDLHRSAAAQGVPVLSGYDLGTTQYARFYDYRRGRSLPFDGMLNVDLFSHEPFGLLTKIIPPGVVPKNLIAALGNTSSAEFSVPQLVDTAGLFGLIAVRVLARYVAGEPVAAEMTIDLDQLVSTAAVIPDPDPVVAEWFARVMA